MKEVSDVKNPGEIERPPEPRSKGKVIGYAIFIILGIGGLAFAGAGAAGYFHVGALSQISQVDALIMLSAGGGAAFTGIAGVCLLKYFGRSRGGTTEDASQKGKGKQYSIEEIAGMSFQELRQLTVSEVAGIDQVQLLDVVGQRLVIALHLANPLRLPTPSPKSINKMTLADLKNVSAQDINDRPSDFPPITFFLLGTQLKEIDTSKLSDTQVQLIFTSNHAIEKNVIASQLSLGQIENCLSKLKDKSLLTPIAHQLRKLDSKYLDQETFDILYPTEGHRSIYINMPLVDKLYTYAPYFREKHWLLLDEGMLQRFDFSKISIEERKKAGQAFSNPDFDKRTLTLLKKAQLEYIKPYIQTLSD